MRRQSVPRDQPQKLTIGLPETVDRVGECLQWLVGRHLCVAPADFLLEGVDECCASAAAAPLVGQRPAGNAEQPRQRLVRYSLEPSPGHEKDVRDDV
ncbi:MAG TPA: hypothetical protein VGH35_00015 [Gaiellaceae bacterium]